MKGWIAMCSSTSDSFLYQPEFDPDELSSWGDHIGLILRRIREIKGISQSDLAAQANVNLSYICSIENHPCNLSIRKLIQICNAMGINSAQIMQILDQDLEKMRLRRVLSRQWTRSELYDFPSDKGRAESFFTLKSPAERASLPGSLSAESE